MSSSTGVYFFDEFDAIGADRGLDNEVGEARRILNSFLQFIEQDESESIIVAATNISDCLIKLYSEDLMMFCTIQCHLGKISAGCLNCGLVRLTETL